MPIGSNGPDYSRLDEQQIIQRVFDENEDRLRTDAQVSVVIGNLDVEVSAADGDTIAISDGINTAQVTPAGNLQVEVMNALEMEVSAADGDNIAISDGTDTLDINADGSINTKVTPYTTIVQYNEVTNVPTSTLTTILSYTATTSLYLKTSQISGTNIAEYRIRVNGVVKQKLYSYWSNFNVFSNFGEGLNISIGDIITIQVLHNRVDSGDFNATIELVDKG